MTDRELLEKAAKAADMWADHFCLDEEDYPIFHEEKGFYLAWGAAWWNPIYDDGDAFRLAVKLGMFGDTGMTFQFMEAVDCGSTRRAIVRAAASIGPTP